MAMRRSVAVMMTASLALTGTATAADAAATRTVALWNRKGSIGREVKVGLRIDGATGYRFARLEPDTPPTHPQHLVTVPDSSALDPGDRDYAVSLRLRTTGKFGNIVQKGQATVSGGNFKLQIPNGIVQCLYRGSVTTLLVSSKRRLNDGRWHTVKCERTSSGVTLTVDGTVEARRSGRTGRIANSWPVSIGGKTSCDQVKVGCDYYVGDLDWIRLQAG
jgi:Laminin G domain